MWGSKREEERQREGVIWRGATVKVKEQPK